MAEKERMKGGLNLEFDFTLPLFDPAQIPSTTSQDPMIKRENLAEEKGHEDDDDAHFDDDHDGNVDEDGDGSDNPDETWKSDATAWLNRARAKTAKSSRKSREKRRKEEDTVYEENKRLKEDRARCLQKIEYLEAYIRNEKSKSGRPVSVEMENELLRMQLEEHKRFIDSYQSMVQGLTDTQSKALASVSKEEAETASTIVSSLIAESATWKPVLLNSRRFQTLKPKRDVTVCYKKMPILDGAGERMVVRIDLVFPGVDLGLVGATYWESMTDESSFRYYFGDPNDGSFKYPFQLKHINVKDNKDLLSLLLSTGALEKVDPGEDFKAIGYTESRPDPQGDRVAHYVCIKRTIELARSTMLLPANLSPRLAQHAPSSKRSTARVFGKTKGIMCTRSKNRPLVVGKINESSKIDNLRADGAIMWAEDNIINKELVHCTRWTCVVEITEGLGQGHQILEKFTDMVMANGELHPRFCAAIDRFAKVCHAQNGKLKKQRSSP